MNMRLRFWQRAESGSFPYWVDGAFDSAATACSAATGKRVLLGSQQQAVTTDKRQDARCVLFLRPGITDLLVSELNRALGRGWYVVGTENLTGALRVAGVLRVDAVVLDLVAWGADGHNILRWLRRDYATTPVIGLVGMDWDAQAQLVRRAGALPVAMGSFWDMAPVARAVAGAVNADGTDGDLCSTPRGLTACVPAPTAPGAGEASTGLIVVDVDGQVRMLNRAASQLLGERRCALLAQLVARLPCPGEVAEFAGRHQDTATNGAVVRVEPAQWDEVTMHCVRLDGSMRLEALDALLIELHGEVTRREAEQRPGLSRLGPLYRAVCGLLPSCVWVPNAPAAACAA